GSSVVETWWDRLNTTRNERDTFLTPPCTRGQRSLHADYLAPLTHNGFAWLAAVEPFPAVEKTGRVPVGIVPDDTDHLDVIGSGQVQCDVHVLDQKSGWHPG